MRFKEIANAEDQLALWRLVSDKVWAALDQQKSQQSNPLQSQQLATSTPKTTIKPVAHYSPKIPSKRKATQAKVHKLKKAPNAPAPKPLPKPQTQQLTPTQASKQQTQQHQQLARHIHQVLLKKPPAQFQSQFIQPSAQPFTSEVPMNNSYSERDKDDLVMHRRQNPFKPLKIK